ncbi:MAG: PASTA domain-containing protein, partial [Clostridia bacterium]|nr:PASTA domain-containing protein [Clostridia bacterium]
ATVEVGYNEEYEADLVYEQSVAQGARVDGGALVGLKVSAGSQWYYLDSFVGQTEQQVQEYMQQNGGSAEFEYILADDQPTGQVLAQSLEPGYQNKEQPVVFTVVGRVISMPDLTGLQLEGALALIHSEGLSEGAVTQEDTPDTAPGVVIDQNIPSGVGVLVGAEVELTVSSQGAAVYAPRVPFTVVAPLENLWVEVLLKTPSGAEFSGYSGRLNRGTTAIPLQSSEAGTHTLTVYIDGVVMETAEILFE